MSKSKLFKYTLHILEINTLKYNACAIFICVHVKLNIKFLGRSKFKTKCSNCDISGAFYYTFNNCFTDYQKETGRWSFRLDKPAIKTMAIK